MTRQYGLLRNGAAAGSGHFENQDGLSLLFDYGDGLRPIEGRFTLVAHPQRRHAPRLAFEFLPAHPHLITLHAEVLIQAQARLVGTTDEGIPFAAGPIMDARHQADITPTEISLRLLIEAREVTLGTVGPCDRLRAYLSNTPASSAMRSTDETVLLDAHTGETLRLRRVPAYKRISQRAEEGGSVAYMTIATLFSPNGAALDPLRAADTLNLAKWLLRFGTAQMVFLPEVVAAVGSRPIWHRVARIPGVAWAINSPVFNEFHCVYPESGLLPFVAAGYPILAALPPKRQQAIKTAIDMYVHAQSGVPYPIPVYDIAYAFEVLREAFLSTDEQCYIGSEAARKRHAKRIQTLVRDSVLTENFYAEHMATMDPSQRVAARQALESNLFSRCKTIFDIPFRDNLKLLLNKQGIVVPTADDGRDWIDAFVSIRNKCVHGSWEPTAGQQHTSGLQPHLDRATALLEVLLLKLLGYRGWYWDRATHTDRPVPSSESA